MGVLPDKFARSGAKRKTEFFKQTSTGLRIAWPNNKTSKRSRSHVEATKEIESMIASTDDVNRQFLDLVRKLLTFAPAERITPYDAMSHPYALAEISEG